MDSNGSSSFLMNSSPLQSFYYQAKEDDEVIDLGLSLRTVQPEAYHRSGHCMLLTFFLIPLLVC